MEKGEDKCVKYTVRLTKRCKKDYDKFSKKANSKLIKTINSRLDELETNPGLGKELTGDLIGMRSIRISEFSFRIIYEVHNTECVIDVYKIALRKNSYKELSRYLGKEQRE